MHVGHRSQPEDGLLYTRIHVKWSSWARNQIVKKYATWLLEKEIEIHPFAKPLRPILGDGVKVDGAFTNGPPWGCSVGLTKTIGRVPMHSHAQLALIINLLVILVHIKSLVLLS